MNFQTFIFYFFSAILLFAGLRVITARNPVHAALYLVLAFFNAAGLWMTLEAEFLAITLVLVYVGAVMVLFLFVVMMLDINLAKLKEGFWDYLPLALPIAILLMLEMAVVLGGRFFGLDKYSVPAAKPADYSNTRELGRLLYTEYVYAFELAAVILLLAIVAAIALTMRKRKDTKYLDPARQVAVKRADRVRLVKMAAEQGSGIRDQESGGSAK
ncbi:MAG: NADH-quinone oxidoreductase subunit J [Pseudomonadota bacterium]